MNDNIEWVLAPREPTEAMWNAGKHFCDGHVTRAIQTYAAMLASAPKPEAQAAGVDVRARYFLASGLDEYGHHSEAQNVRDGEDLESYRHELFAIKAALSTPASHDAQQQALTDVQYPDADSLIAHLAGLCDDGGQGGEWDVAQAAIAGIRAFQQPAVVGDGVRDALRTIDTAVEVLEDRQRPAMAEDLEGARRVLAAALTPAATPGEKEVKCRRCMDTQQEFNYNGDGPFPCRHCYDAQKEGNGNG